MATAYQQALDYIYSFVDYETQARPRDAEYYDLRRVEDLLERVGNPHVKARTIHVAGTKGKGSTAAMIANALIVSGYSTGLYTSPHLHTYNERIRVNGELIPDDTVVKLVERLQPEVKDINDKATYGKITTFEIITVMGFMYFEMMNVDFQVIEVGLGGRLDATNVTTPEICVLTTIGLDHTDVLGNTLTAIASEKAGIIKKGITVVSSAQPEEADIVFENTSRDLGAELIKVGREVTWESVGYDYSGQTFTVQGRRDRYDLTIPLLGDHQIGNAVTAVAVLEVLMDRGFSVTKESLTKGLAEVNWPGRMQIIGHNPLLVVDGAHTPESAGKVRQTLKKYFTYDQAVLIIGSSSDKDITGIVVELAPVFDKVVVTRSIHPRSMPADQIVAEFKRLNVEGVIAQDITAAYELAFSMAGEKDLICATGSLFIVAGIIEEAEKHG